MASINFDNGDRVLNLENQNRQDIALTSSIPNNNHVVQIVSRNGHRLSPVCNKPGENQEFILKENTNEMIESRNGQNISLQLNIPKNYNEDENAYDYGQNVHYRKQKRAISVTGSVYEGRSPSAQPNRPVSFNRRISYQPSISGTSISSQLDKDIHIPPPSTSQEKSKMTRQYFATVCAIGYAIFLVTFGSVVFIGNAVSNQYLLINPLAEAFSIAMIVIAFAYFIFLYIDIRLHVSKANKSLKDREKREKFYEQQMSNATLHFQGGPLELPESSNGNIHLQVEINDNNFPPIKPVSHKYCFATGRHGEFFYLKLGAAWFCFGLLINYSLIISYQIIFLTSTEPNFYKCASVIELVFDILFPLYSLFLLFFIFKYANVIINENRGLARLSLMHAIGTSLAFWVFTIVRETSDSIRLKDYYEKEKENKTNVKELDFMLDHCPGPGALNVIYRNFSPYLYPFIIEFCILIVGIFYMMYANINKCPKIIAAQSDNHMSPGSPVEFNQEENRQNINKGVPSEISEHYRSTAEHDNQFKSNLVIHADCHAANRGLFGGLILIVLTIVFIILFFVAINDEEYFQIGITMDSIFELIVLIIMLIAVIITYFQTSKLDVNTTSMSMLDDVLLFIAIPAFFLETIFSMLPAIENRSVLNICTIFAQLLQIIVQTPFIIDGLRRCSNLSILRKKKPGREMITFLTIANVSLWIYYTFSVKNAYIGDERYKYYGDVLWTILNHLSLPLIMFYRFHSSVCLVDIWRHAYEPGGH